MLGQSGVCSGHDRMAATAACVLTTPLALGLALMPVGAHLLLVGVINAMNLGWVGHGPLATGPPTPMAGK